MATKKVSTPRKKSASQKTYTQQVRTLERGLQKEEDHLTLDFIRAV